MSRIAEVMTALAVDSMGETVLLPIDAVITFVDAGIDVVAAIMVVLMPLIVVRSVWTVVALPLIMETDKVVSLITVTSAVLKAPLTVGRLDSVDASFACGITVDVICIIVVPFALSTVSSMVVSFSTVIYSVLDAPLTAGTLDSVDAPLS